MKLCWCLHKTCLINSEIIWNAFWLPNYVYKENMQSLCLLWNYRELCGERKLWNVTFPSRKNNSLTLVHKNWLKDCTLLTSLWISCLKSVKNVISLNSAVMGILTPKYFTFAIWLLSNSVLLFQLHISSEQHGVCGIISSSCRHKNELFSKYLSVRNSPLELLTLNSVIVTMSV